MKNLITVPVCQVMVSFLKMTPVDTRSMTLSTVLFFSLLTPGREYHEC